MTLHVMNDCVSAEIRVKLSDQMQCVNWALSEQCTQLNELRELCKKRADAERVYATKLKESLKPFANLKTDKLRYFSSYFYDLVWTFGATFSL